MIGLAAIGLALILAVGMRIAATAGVPLLAFTTSSTRWC
jgi:hypothetical protein